MVWGLVQKKVNEKLGKDTVAGRLNEGVGLKEKWRVNAFLSSLFRDMN
jgi:hypothetical protein